MYCLGARGGAQGRERRRMNGSAVAGSLAGRELRAPALQPEHCRLLARWHRPHDSSTGLFGAEDVPAGEPAGRLVNPRNA